jgi:hypothetical protein
VKRLTIFVSLVAWVLATTGCITHVSVVKVTAENNACVKGERVKLPAPFIVGTPAPDGSIKYSVQYFADPDQEYAIDSWSFMAKQKLDISRTVDMIATKLTLAQDSTAVANQLAGSLGNVGKGVEDSLVTKEQAKVTAAQAAAKAKKDNVTAKQADLAAKDATVAKDQAAVDSAQAVLDALKTASPPDATAIKAAQATLTTAQLALTQAKIDRDYSNQALTVAANADLAAPADLPKAKGIVIYRIVDNHTGLRLVPVKFDLFSMDGTTPVGSGSQLDFETSGAKSKGQTTRIQSGQDAFKMGITPAGTSTSQDIFFNTEIKATDATTPLTDAKGKVQATQATAKVSDSKTAVSLGIPGGLPAGAYTIQLKVVFADDLTGTFPLAVSIK